MTKNITRAVRPEDLRDLLDRPPRAHVSFARDGGIEALPAAFWYVDGRYFIGLSSDGPLAGEEVSLLVDDGEYYYQLRGFRVQGRIAAAEPPPGAPPGLSWSEVVADRVAAWHYGRMRERAE